MGLEEAPDRGRDGDVVRLEMWPTGELAATAAVRMGGEERWLEPIVSIAQVGNDASERIMTGLGSRPEPTDSGGNKDGSLAADRELVLPGGHGPTSLEGIEARGTR